MCQKNGALPRAFAAYNCLRGDVYVIGSERFLMIAALALSLWPIYSGPATHRAANMWSVEVRESEVGRECGRSASLAKFLCSSLLHVLSNQPRSHFYLLRQFPYILKSDIPNLFSITSPRHDSFFLFPSNQFLTILLFISKQFRYFDECSFWVVFFFVWLIFLFQFVTFRKIRIRKS